METGPRPGEDNGRTHLSPVRLEFRRTPRTDRCETRGSATAGREVYQFEQPGDYTSLDRQNRERSKNRRALDRRTSGFPQIDSPRLTPPAPRGAAIAAAGRRRG